MATLHASMKRADLTTTSMYKTRMTMEVVVRSFLVSMDILVTPTITLATKNTIDWCELMKLRHGEVYTPEDKASIKASPNRPSVLCPPIHSTKLAFVSLLEMLSRNKHAASSMRKPCANSRNIISCGLPLRDSGSHMACFATYSPRRDNAVKPIIEHIPSLFCEKKFSLLGRK